MLGLKEDIDFGVEVTFDEKSLYYIYEDDGPVTE